MPDSVAIVSGGMDSVTLLHYLVKVEKRRPAVLSFIYGQKHSKEVGCARAQAELLGCTPHLVLDLALLQPLFASSALVAAGVAVPDMAAVAGDPQPPTSDLSYLSVYLRVFSVYLRVTNIPEGEENGIRYPVFSRDCSGQFECGCLWSERCRY